MPLQLQLKDVIETKKPHPCGGYQFMITRTGMDFRMQCLKCTKEIWIERPKLEKRIKKIFREGVEIPKV
jgi:hypothetical protein